MKLRTAINNCKQVKVKVSDCCPNSFYVDVTKATAKDYLKPYLDSQHLEHGKYQSNVKGIYYNGNSDMKYQWVRDIVSTDDFMSNVHEVLTGEKLIQQHCQCDEDTFIQLSDDNSVLWVGY